jgi:signal transduction histidine kinase
MPIHLKSSKRDAQQPANPAEPSARPSATQKIRVRLDELFADIKRLSNDPASASPEIRFELETLRTRLIELEKQVKESQETLPLPDEKPQIPNVIDAQAQPAMDVEMPTTAPTLYEREQIGFVYADNKLQQVRDPGELTDVSAAVTVPLIAGGQSIGKVQLASPAERTWTPDDTAIVNSVAEQVSQQIQSLRLLAETERARSESESATRQFIHEGWTSYLDAIHKNERIGYAYDQDAVSPFIEKLEADKVIEEPVNVMEEQVGAIYLTPGPDRALVEGDKQMMAAIADQIALQVENIRLLADASRARAEADEVVRRMTRETWESFTEEKEPDSLSFAYNTNEVTPFGEQLPEDVALTLPLLVRGEAIGQLAVTGEVNISPEAADLANAIAEQASAHLETLRLNEELQKRAAELLELDRLKMGFLANMSHELRTPLNSILGFSDVILEELDGPLTPTMTSDLQLIQKNGKHLLHLINDVLDMAKITAGRMNLDPEKLNVHDILEEVTSITSTLASEKNLALFIESDSDQNLQITVDRTRLRQVLINLVNNAIKFTEKGHIAIRAGKKDDENILITVKDTGIGIPADKLEVIFQEFTQVDISSTRKAGGTGLGLPISRRLVEMHGGKLWAESTGVSDEGSTFFVELPLVARITDVVEKKEK